MVATPVAGSNAPAGTAMYTTVVTTRKSGLTAELETGANAIKIAIAGPSADPREKCREWGTRLDHWATRV
jgi:hypothetical protein